MAAINYTDQFNFTGKGYLDAKIQPVKNIDELLRIPRAHRFIGLTVTVLDDGNNIGPVDYWLKESVSLWEIKIVPGAVTLNGDDYKKE